MYHRLLVNYLHTQSRTVYHDAKHCPVHRVRSIATLAYTAFSVYRWNTISSTGGGLLCGSLFTFIDQYPYQHPGVKIWAIMGQ